MHGIESAALPTLASQSEMKLESRREALLVIESAGWRMNLRTSNAKDSLRRLESNG